MTQPKNWRAPRWLLLAQLLLALGTHPMPSFAKWAELSTQFASLRMRDSVNQVSLSQSGLTARKSIEPNETSLFLSATLAVLDPDSGAQRRTITINAYTFGTSPAVLTPRYDNPGAATTLNVSLQGAPAQGCVTEPSGEQTCGTVALYVAWDAAGARLRTYEDASSSRITDHSANPPSRTESSVKTLAVEYQSTDAVSLRVVKSGTLEVLFEGQISCQDARSCLFLIGAKPQRTLVNE